jgi:RNA polymerase sigma-70 factor, ECF subfamily
MDRREFTERYRAFAPLVFRRCRRLLGEEAEASDATQEVFVQLLLYAERLRFGCGEDCLRWLYRVSTHLCVKRLVRARRCELREPSALPEVAVGCGAEARLVSRETLARVLAAVDERAQAVFVLAFLDGLTQEEIAGVLEVSRRTVVKKLERLRSVAQELMGARGAT